jgi:type I restriction enzyme S subunit
LSGTTGQLLFASLNESGAKAGLNLPTVASIPFPVPKMQEQNMIVQALQQADIVVKQEEIYLSKLHRLKAGLMQDLLSGRVSVAGLVETISARE